MRYDQLLSRTDATVKEVKMPTTIRGLYADGVVWVNKNLGTQIEKTCILCEEIGHHLTATENIIRQTSVQQIKQELRGRQWAYEQLIPLSSLIAACSAGLRNQYELAEFLGVTEEFLCDTLKFYRHKYGCSCYKGNHILVFDPLHVEEKIKKR